MAVFRFIALGGLARSVTQIPGRHEHETDFRIPIFDEGY